MDDSQLLQDFIANRSQRAFALLVERHIQLVYAAARRQVRDVHLAEDVAQAVFVTLARRAKTIRSGAVLPAWLLTATRYSASNHLTALNRRRHHERRAAQMIERRAESGGAEVVVSDDDSIASQLDEAMARLNARDRSAVAMRYLQGKSMREVGDLMGVSEEAAQKRIVRAIEKLRAFFARQGIAMDSAADVINGLSRQLAQAAPTTLAPAVTAAALSSAASSGAGTIGGIFGKLLGIASGKAAAAACIVAVVAAGTSAVVVQSRRAGATNFAAAPSAPSAPAAAAPTKPGALWQPFTPDNSPPISSVSFNNLALMPMADTGYDCGIDPNVKRTPESGAAGVIHPADGATPDVKNAGVRIVKAMVQPYLGKRVRLSGWLRTEAVEHFAGLMLVVTGPGGRIEANDDMGGRPVLGTTDWTRYEIVADVPATAEGIVLGGVLRGKGTLWMDGVELAVVNNTVPISDDRRWHLWSFTPDRYHVELDKNELRNGHPTLCLSSTAKIPPGGWGSYDRNDRTCENWNGKRVRMTGWMKAEGVTAPSGLTMRALGPNFQTLKRDSSFPNRPVRGTSGWLKYSITLDVPENAQGVDLGLVMNGGGKIWLDDVSFEVVAPGKQ